MSRGVPTQEKSQSLNRTSEAPDAAEEAEAEAELLPLPLPAAGLRLRLRPGLCVL
jgi:hypothetical protein